MKKKLLISFLTLTFLFYTSAAFTPQARAITIITSPVTFFSTAIKGNVSYHFLGRIFAGIHAVVPSAAGLTITIANFFDNGQKYTGITDSDGSYEVGVPNGLYDVSVQDNGNTFFTPPFDVVSVHDAIATANFQGLVFPSF